MTVITISREFGSEGDVIAQQTSQRLGYHLVDHKFIEVILGQYGYVEFDKEYANLPTFWERFDAQRDVMAKMLDRVIQAVASHGNVVILGRSGFAVLDGYSDVLHVRLQAPFSVRVRRIMEQQEVSFEQAEEIVKRNDKVRVSFVEEFYRVPWSAIHAFDLVINTGKVSPDLATNWVIDAAKALTDNLEEDKPTTESIVVDHIMAGAISDALKCHKVHGILPEIMLHPSR